MWHAIPRSLVALACALLCGSAVAQTAAEAESNLFPLNTAVTRIDSDGDGMPDAWETAHGLNPLLADASGNPDGDGLTNLEEYNADSDPQVFEAGTIAFAVSGLFTVQTRSDAPDQDGDGLPDAWEIANGLKPNANDYAFSDAYIDAVARFAATGTMTSWMRKSNLQRRARPSVPLGIFGTWKLSASCSTTTTSSTPSLQGMDRHSSR